MKKICQNPKCGKGFEAHRFYPRQKYCSHECAEEVYKPVRAKMSSVRYHKNPELYCQGQKAYRAGKGRFKHALSGYKRGAFRRSREWSLTDEQAVELFAMPCHYCGGTGGGIDRVDNRFGYIPGNVVPCCSTCNWMKHKMGVEEFLAHVARIAAHQLQTSLFASGAGGLSESKISISLDRSVFFD